MVIKLYANHTEVLKFVEKEKKYFLATHCRVSYYPAHYDTEVLVDDEKLKVSRALVDSELFSVERKPECL